MVTLNPSITPEHYSTAKTPAVKALFISFNKYIQPQIVTDIDDKILSAVFKDEKPYPIFYDDEFHMYVSPSEQLIGMNVNSVATFFIRQKNIQLYGSLQQDVVCGNILIFGTKNLKKQIIDNKNYSVPYHIVEEVVRIYDIEKKY
jgi:hypothetical protein